MRGLFATQRPGALVGSDEAGDEVVRGILGDLVGRAELRDLARPSAGSRPGRRAGTASSMSWVTKTMVLSSSRCRRERLGLQLFAHDRVDRAERLVHQQDVRVDGEAASHADPLLLAAGELAGVALGERTGRGRRHPSVRGPARGPPSRATPVSTGHCRDVVDHREVGQQPGVLQHVADAAAKRHGIAPGDGFAVDRDSPPVGRSGG